MDGRLGRITVTAAAVVGLVVLAACDTGDGKQLKPYDPADYPSQTVAPSSVASGLDGDVGSDAGFPFGSGGAGANEPTSPTEPFALIAPWAPGANIDAEFTCDGADVAPAVSWGGVPDRTVEIALSLVDDSAVSNGEPFVHWTIGGIDPAEIALAEGDVPDGAVQALNFLGDVGYSGPCPPPGDAPHLYRLTIFALDQHLELPDGTPASVFSDAIDVHAIGSTDVTGSYGR